MLDRLVRGPVLAHADGVVGEHVDHAQLHQRRQADGVAAVVAEGEEGTAVGNPAAVRGHAVHQRGHAEFAHAEVVVARAGVRKIGEVGAGEIGAAAHQLGQVRRHPCQHLLRGLARGDALRAAGKGVDDPVAQRVPVGGQSAVHAPQEGGGQPGVILAVGVETAPPVGLQLGAARTRIPLRADPGGDLEGRVAPAQRLARRGHLVGAQRFAVRLGGAAAMRRAGADGGAAHDEGGPAVATPRGRQCGVQRVQVVAVDGADDIPAVGAQAPGGVVAEPAGDGPVDADAVVVVQRDQLVQAQHAGQRERLVADALHHAAVAQEHVGAMVDDGVAGTVEFVGQHPLGQRHAHRAGDALPQRPGGDLHARRDAALGMAGRPAVQLAEVFDLRHRQVVAGQMQHGVLQHRGMAVAEHEAVAVGPVRVGGVEAQVAAPQRHRHLGHAHGRPGVAGVGLLHGIHGQYTQRGGAGIARGIAVEDAIAGRAGHAGLLGCAPRPG